MVDRRQLLRLVAAGGLPLAGCTGGDQGQAPMESPTASETAASTPSSVDMTISMKNTTFQTLKAEVDTGATVEWINNDGYLHTITSAQFHDVAASWSFDQQVAAGERATHTFDERGVYEYYCTAHGKSQMCGVVLVGGATLDKSLPCGGGGSGGGYGGSGY